MLKCPLKIFAIKLFLFRIWNVNNETLENSSDKHIFEHGIQVTNMKLFM